MVFKAVYTLFVQKRYMFHSNTFFKLRLVCFGLPPAATSGEVAAGEPKKRSMSLFFLKQQVRSCRDQTEGNLISNT